MRGRPWVADPGLGARCAFLLTQRLPMAAHVLADPRLRVTSGCATTRRVSSPPRTPAAIWDHGCAVAEWRDEEQAVVFGYDAARDAIGTQNAARQPSAIRIRVAEPIQGRWL